MEKAPAMTTVHRDNNFMNRKLRQIDRLDFSSNMNNSPEMGV